MVTSATAEEIPEGYKLTGVGIIPEDWNVVELKSIINFNNGSAHENHISAYGKYIVVNSKFISTEGAVAKYSNHLLCPTSKGNILMVMSDVPNGRAIAKCFLVDQNNKYTINQRICSLEPKEVNSKFLYYILNRNRFYLKFDDGVKQTNLRRQDVLGCPLIMPSKKEQTAIATALSDVDSLITSLGKLIEKKRAIKTAAMGQLLTGKKRLPPFDKNHTGYKQTEVGVIPEDWEVRAIGSFTDCTAGGTPSTVVPIYWGGKHPWMSSGELHLKRIKDVREKITDIGLKNSSTKYIPKYCVLIGLAGQGKTRGTVAINEIELCTNQSIAAIYPGKMHITDFLFYNLEIRYEELRGMSTGDGGRGGLNLTIIRNIFIAIPSIEEQAAIATVLSNMDKEIEALEQRLAKTQKIKQGMMQELLTGRTRLV